MNGENRLAKSLFDFQTETMQTISKHWIASKTIFIEMRKFGALNMWFRWFVQWCTCPHNVHNRFEYAIDTTQLVSNSDWMPPIHAPSTCMCFWYSRSFGCTDGILLLFILLVVLLLLILSIVCALRLLLLFPFRLLHSHSVSIYAACIVVFVFHSIICSYFCFLLLLFRSLLCVLTQSLLCCVRFLLLWTFFFSLLSVCLEHCVIIVFSVFKFDSFFFHFPFYWITNKFNSLILGVLKRFQLHFFSYISPTLAGSASFNFCFCYSMCNCCCHSRFVLCVVFYYRSFELAQITAADNIHSRAHRQFFSSFVPFLQSW